LQKLCPYLVPLMPSNVNSRFQASYSASGILFLRSTLASMASKSAVMFSNALSPMWTFQCPKQMFIVMMPVRFYCITAGPGPHRSATVVIVHPAPTLTHSTTSWPQGKPDAPLCAIVKTLHYDFLTVRCIAQFHSMVIVS
jgi:hypothetical protein